MQYINPITERLMDHLITSLAIANASTRYDISSTVFGDIRRALVTLVTHAYRVRPEVAESIMVQFFAAWGGETEGRGTAVLRGIIEQRLTVNETSRPFIQNLV